MIGQTISHYRIRSVLGLIGLPSTFCHCSMQTKSRGNGYRQAS